LRFLVFVRIRELNVPNPAQLLGVSLAIHHLLARTYVENPVHRVNRK